jgi:hypothetical protein
MIEAPAASHAVTDIDSADLKSHGLRRCQSLAGWNRKDTAAVVEERMRRHHIDINPSVQQLDIRVSGVA